MANLIRKNMPRTEYQRLHSWMKFLLGVPKECEHCGKKGKKTGKKRPKWNIELANKSGTYLNDKNDWLGLCKHCHHKYDGVNQLELY